MSDTIWVQVPKESVSDDSVLLVQWLVATGASVAPGTPIATIETSKNAIDLEAVAGGYLHHLAVAGDRIAIGANIAAITDSPRPPAVSAKVREPGASVGLEDTRFSQAARLLIEKHKLDAKEFAHLPLVRREDVEAKIRAKQSPASKLDIATPGPNDLVVFGGGGHAKVCIEILRVGGKYRPWGIIDAAIPVGTLVLGVPVVGTESALEEVYRRGVRFAALGVGAVRAHATRGPHLQRLRDAGYELPNLIHPTAAIDMSVRLGAGNVVFAHATLSADATIGDGGILNSGCVVSHDCRLGNNVHLAPGALLAGGVTVGDDTLIGMGVAVFLGTKIGRGARINNGAVVDRDVEEGGVVSR